MTRILTNPNWPAGFVTGLAAAAMALAVACTWPRPEESLAVALLAHPITAPAVSESLCDDHWERDTEGWWTCFLALETDRCVTAGWCGALPEVVYVVVDQEIL